LINKYDLLDPACYPGSGTVINDLVGTVDLGTNGSPTYDATNGSLTWNGLGVGAYSSAGSYVNITTTFTFSIWFKINDVSQVQLLINNGERTSSWSGYSDFITPTTGQLDFGANYVWGGIHSCPNLDPTKWYNATYTFSGGTLNFYINGALVSTVTGLGSPNAYGPNAYLALGGNATAFFGAPQYQNKASYGVVLFYNTALNSTQVNDIYLTYVDRFFPPIHEYDAADPASYPGSGPTFFDIGSAPINLTINNATFDSVNDSFTLQGGSSSYIRSAEPVSIGIGTNNFSYQLWYQFNGQSTINDCQLQVGSRGGSTFGGCNFAAVGGQLIVEAPGVSGWTTGFYPTAGKWYLLSLTVNSSNLNTLYVNGVSFGTTTQAYNPLGAIASIAMGPAVTNLADGSLSGYGALQIYDRVISPAEITNYYNETEARFNPAVHAYDAADPSSYPGSGSTLSDIGTATAINLTINDATFNATNDSFTLDGTLSSYIRSANSLAGFDIGGNDFSVQYWFKYNAPTVTPPYSIFLQIGSRGGTFNGFTHFIAGGELNIGKPGIADYATGFYPTIDQWYQITMTVDSSNDVILYVDSASEYTDTISFVTPNNILAMGDNGIQSDQVFDGSMGPLFLFDRVLSPAEITTYYNSTVARFFPPPPAGGLVGGRTFGQGFAG
jgi:hypothetical protein